MVERQGCLEAEQITTGWKSTVEGKCGPGRFLTGLSAIFLGILSVLLLLPLGIGPSRALSKHILHIFTNGEWGEPSEVHRRPRNHKGKRPTDWNN